MVQLWDVFITKELKSGTGPDLIIVCVYLSVYPFLNKQQTLVHPLSTVSFTHAPVERPFLLSVRALNRFTEVCLVP